MSPHHAFSFYLGIRKILPIAQTAIHWHNLFEGHSRVSVAEILKVPWHGVLDNLLRLPFPGEVQGFFKIPSKSGLFHDSGIRNLSKAALLCVGFQCSTLVGLRIRAVAKAQLTLNFFFFLRLFYQTVIFDFPARTAVILLEYLLQIDFKTSF